MGLRLTLPPILLLVATAPAGTTPRVRPTPREECRPQHRVELNLAAWKASLKRAETPQRHAEVLSELKLSLDLGDSKTSAGLPEGSHEDSHEDSPEGSAKSSDDTALASTQVTVTLLGIDDALAQLGSDTLPDHVIQARYRIQRADEITTAYLIQIARPVGGPGWCLLGTELSRQDAGAAKIDSYVLGFVSLLNAKTKAIEVKVVQAQLRHGEIIRQYWVAEGFGLKKIFDHEIASMDNIGGSGETMAKSGTIALIGEFPKRIEFKETSKRVICDAGGDEATCKESERSSTTIFAYDGRAYARRK